MKDHKEEEEGHNKKGVDILIYALLFYCFDVKGSNLCDASIILNAKTKLKNLCDVVSNLCDAPKSAKH